MKLTLKNVNQIRKDSNSPLVKRVCNYIRDEWSCYDDKKHIFTDVLYHDCQTGIVGFLIYYSDTVAFYKKYKSEIDTLLLEALYNYGSYSIPNIFGDKWDKEDPLANDIYNQNLLAWFGFEETLRNIGYNFETLQDLI